jgi:hypothetical protein
MLGFHAVAEAEQYPFLDGRWTARDEQQVT